MKKQLLASLAVIALGVSAINVQAATSQANFQVTMTVNKSCSVTAGAASNIALGSHNVGDTDVAANSTISVKCSNGLAYSVGLKPGNDSTTGAGAMKLGSESVPYQLRKAAGMTGAVWGNDATNWYSATASNASAQSLTVYATVAEVPAVTDGNYTDTVTVTVTY